MATYAVSDLHGVWELWRQITDFVKPEDTLYVLGDAADRGEHGWRIIKDCLSRPNVKYLLGNHDVMLLDSLCPEDWDNCETGEFWMHNGGLPTKRAIFADPNAKEFIEELSKMSYYEKFINSKGQIIHLSHAGFNISEEIPDEAVELVWDRAHLCREYWDGDENEFLVFGHTPIQKFYSSIIIKNGIGYLNNGHKIDIDNGCVFSGAASILDLDTLETATVVTL